MTFRALNDCRIGGIVAYLVKNSASLPGLCVLAHDAGAKHLDRGRDTFRHGIYLLVRDPRFADLAHHDEGDFGFDPQLNEASGRLVRCPEDFFAPARMGHSQDGFDMINGAGTSRNHHR